MSLRRAGFFRELSHGDPTGPSLEASRAELGPEDRKRASEYLHGGSILATTGVLVDDWFDGTRAVAPQEVRTDGEWVWPGDYAYYVERHGVEVQQQLLSHMATKNWIANELTAEELLEAEEQFFRSDH